MWVKRLVPFPTCVGLAAVLIIGCGEDTVMVPKTGSLQISLQMTGAAPDSNGCTVTIDDTHERRLMNGELVLVSGLSDGLHMAVLSGLAPHCSVQGDVVRSVVVGLDRVAVLTYIVDCPAPGSFEVATHTAGSGITPNAYSIGVDWTDYQLIRPDATVTFPGLAPGDHVVKLSLGASDCAVLGDNPRTIVAVEGLTIRIDFTVLCPPFYDHIAFSSGSDLWVVKPDGSNPVNITQDPFWNDYPSWAPDASSIATTSNPGDVYALAFRPQTRARLTRNAGVELSAWSPDGTRIAYSSFTGASQGAAWGDVYVMNADGTDPVNLTPGAARGFDPAWSPDGSQIVFANVLDEGVWVMGADGSSPRPLITGIGDVYEPAWSPDGEHIAFVGPGSPCCGIWVMNADGSNPVQLVEGYTWRPAWSPDGSRIVYYESGGGIYVMNADGTGSVRIANGYYPAWSADQP